MFHVIYQDAKTSKWWHCYEDISEDKCKECAGILHENIGNDVLVLTQEQMQDFIDKGKVEAHGPETTG